MRRWQRFIIILIPCALVTQVAFYAAVSTVHDGAAAAAAAPSCEAHPTTFLHVGPDLDTYSLRLLQPCELRVVYVEPLTWRLNKDRIDAFRQTHESAGDFDNAAVKQKFDALFECDDVSATSACRRALSRDDVSLYAAQLEERLAITATLGCNATATTSSGFDGFKLLGRPHVHFAESESEMPSVSFDFVSGGRRRQLLVLIAPIAQVDWAAALTSDDARVVPVSTMVYTGVSGLNAQVGADAVCDGGRAARTLRFMRRPFDDHGVGDPQIFCAGKRPGPSRELRWRCPSPAENATCLHSFFHGCYHTTAIEEWTPAGYFMRGWDNLLGLRRLTYTRTNTYQGFK